MSVYPQLIKASEKHSDRYFLIDSYEDLDLISRILILERLNEGWYANLDGAALTLVESIKTNPDRDTIVGRTSFLSPTEPIPTSDAWRFLRSRCAYEYEDVEFVPLTSYRSN